ncbi:MAG: ChaN family lipoprotein, partial [Maritimibacter sp.]
MRYAITLIAAIFAALPVWAGGLDGVAADVVVLGEQHDNPAHHLVQAEAVAELAPKALVFEMLTEAQAERAVPELRADA